MADSHQRRMSEVSASVSSAHLRNSTEEDLPGTVHLYLDAEQGIVRQDGQAIQKTDNNVVLRPQPTNSPNDPLNWSSSRKIWHTLLCCLVTGLTAATSNDAGAAQNDLNENEGISWASFNVGAGVLFIGIGYFTLLLSPTAYLYGRRIAYFVCIFIGLWGALWFARVKVTSDAIWSQLFVGASEAVAEAHVQLSLSDIFYQHQLPSVLGLYVASTSVGTFLGPLIAGIVADSIGWEWVGYMAVIVSGFVLILLYFGLEETFFDRNAYQTRLIDASTVVNKHPAIIDDQFEKKQAIVDASSSGSQTAVDYDNSGIDEVTNVNDAESAGASDKPHTYWQRIALITPAPNLVGLGIKQYFRRLWLTLRVFAFPAVIYSGFQWGTQDAWLTFYITTEDDAWSEEPHNYGDLGIAIMNIPTLIGALIGCYYAGWLSDHFCEWMAKRNGGTQEAEHRLWAMIPAGIIAPIGMFLFGIGTERNWAWGAPYVGLGFIGFGWGCAGDISMSYVADAYPEAIIECMTGISVINNTLGCIFSFACDPWIQSLGVENAYIAVGVCEFVFIMFTIPMIYWGKSARRATKNMYLRFVEERDGL